MFDQTDVRFRDRRDAGRALARALDRERLGDPLILGLPRGGMPVADEVARAVDAPLDVFVARKIGAPGHPEFGIGAVAEGSDRVLLADQAAHFELSDEDVDRLAAAERAELTRRVQQYRGGRRLPDLAGRDVVLVDDGLATGVTAEAALLALRDRSPGRLVLGVPVCAQASVSRLAAIADVVCVHRPAAFRSVGAWYDDFGQTSDAEVLQVLDRAEARRRARTEGATDRPER